MRPALQDHLFHVSYPTGDGWRWSVRGAASKAYGPHPSEAAALEDRWQLLQRWKAQAARQGGFVVCLTRIRWNVVLPVGIDCAGLPLHGAVSEGSQNA